MTPMRGSTTEMVGYTGEAAPVNEVRQSVRFTRLQVIIIVVSMLVTATAAVAMARLSPPAYETTRSMIVLSGSNPNDNEVLARALESLVTSKGLAAEVKRRGDLPQSIDEISGTISTSRAPDSAYMDVIASSPDKEFSEAVSAQIIPALSSVFERAQEEQPVEKRINGPIFQQVFANPLQQTTSFPTWFAAVFGLLLGGLVPFFIFLIRNLRQPVVASAQDVTEALDLPVLVKVPSLDSRGGNPQDAVAGIISAIERLSLNEPIHRLVLVGADDGKDRAQIAVALACVISRSFGQPVALIDADLENAVMTDQLGTSDVAGLAECLAGQIDTEAALLGLSETTLPPNLEGIRAPDGMVRFLGAGVDRSRNVVKMRTSFHRVLEGLAGRYVVIVNGPRLPGPVPVAQVLSLADASLVVVSEGRTSLNDARSVGDTLRSYSTGPAGVIVLRH